MDRTRLTGPLALFGHCEAIERAASDPRGLLRLRLACTSARLWLGRKDRTTGASRAGGPMATKAVARPRYACATATAATRPAIGPRPRRRNSQDRWYFCEAHAAEYNRNWNYFAGLSAEEAARRAAEEEQGNSGFGSPPNGSGAGRATAAEAATRCARSARSTSTATPTSRPSRLRTGAWSRKRIPTRTRAMPKRPSASSRCRPLTTSSKRPRSEKRKAGLAGPPATASSVSFAVRQPGDRRACGRGGTDPPARGWSCGVPPGGVPSCGGPRRGHRCGAVARRR